MGYIQLKRSDELNTLIKHKPNAFILLTVIAIRARRTPCIVTGLKEYQAYIGDYKNYGMTEQKYRTAKNLLEKREFITTKATNKGTIATLCSVVIYDINANEGNEQTNTSITDKQRTSNGQVTTNKKDKNVQECKNDKNKRKASSMDEVIDFCLELRLQRNDGEFLWHKWQENDWINGKNKIKDWKATIRAWKAGGYLPSQKNNKTQQSDELSRLHTV